MCDCHTLLVNVLTDTFTHYCKGEEMDIYTRSTTGKLTRTTRCAWGTCQESAPRNGTLAGEYCTVHGQEAVNHSHADRERIGHPAW